MIVLIAPDKFKGSLTARQVCEAIKEGLLAINPALSINSIPLADGGEGTGELLTDFSGGSYVKVKAFDPLFREIDSVYGISSDGRTAFIEMANISGLQLLQPEERNPLYTSTFGTGELILHAMKHGARHIILGIGGSATNDAGIGMAEALGFSFYSSDNKKLNPTGENLQHISKVEKQNVNPLLSQTKFTVLCDVTNPLYGKNGAAHVFGPQKGADAAAIEILDLGLQNFKKITAALNKENDFPGAGAAGGLGSGTRVFLNAGLSQGFNFISTFTKLEGAVAKADLVITGEGKIDLQSLSGKVVRGVADLAKQYGKPCFAFTGKLDLSPTLVADLGFQAVISISNGYIAETEAITNAFSILKMRTNALKPLISAV
ncbi:glycerate kinase [soil metagenome]